MKIDSLELEQVKEEHGNLEAAIKDEEWKWTELGKIKATKSSKTILIHHYF